VSGIPRVLTVDAVAVHLACAEHTVYRLLTSGRLVGFKVGTAWRVTETALLAFMWRAAVPPVLPPPSFTDPADPSTFDRLLPTRRVFS
jgi:excisionase family DNA binding protein